MSNLNTIKEIIQELLEKGGFIIDDIVIDENSVFGAPCFRITSSDPGPLIGTHGDVLMSINHVVRRMAEQKYPSPHSESPTDTQRFIIDVNQYQQNRVNNLKAKADIIAERARSFKKDFEFEPMSAYERLIIHSHLSHVRDIATESTGAGRERRVVVKYQGQ